LNKKQEIEILLTIITIMDTTGNVHACVAAVPAVTSHIEIHTDMHF